MASLHFACTDPKTPSRERSTGAVTAESEFNTLNVRAAAAVSVFTPGGEEGGDPGDMWAVLGKTSAC